MQLDRLENKTTRTSLELSTIIEACKKQDRKAQELLFKHLYGKMFAVIRRYIPDQDLAQDILQDGFIKVFDKMVDFDNSGSFEGWVRRIMVNGAIDHIRKVKKIHFVSDSIAHLDDKNDDVWDQEQVDAIELKAEFALEAIDNLSPAYRTVFNLYVMEGFTHKQIADTLGISEGTSKSNLAKAKMNLQTVLNKKFNKTQV